MATIDLRLPVSEDQVRALRLGDQVRLHGTLVTARDAAHKYMMDNFFKAAEIPAAERQTHDRLAGLWRDGALYHCGPVVRRNAAGQWEFVSAGPTTSIREEPYEADAIAHFGVRAVIGKGGMGPRTLAAFKEHGAVYLHAVGGAATLIATTIREVLDVYKKEELGSPEAFWVVRAEGFRAVVTMDANGGSLHEQMYAESGERLTALLR
jgi:fumarate hydratase class I